MTRKPKRWSEMTTQELAAATREFDSPDFQPRARKPTKREAAALERIRKKSADSRFRIALLLDLVEAADDGVTFRIDSGGSI